MFLFPQYILQHDEEDGMGVVGNDDKTVGKSKIQHNLRHTSKTASGNEGDEMEDKDSEEDDNAESEKPENPAEDGLNDKGESDKKKSKENKDEEDDKSNSDQVENPNRDETTSSTKDLPEVKVNFIPCTLAKIL